MLLSESSAFFLRNLTKGGWGVATLFIVRKVGLKYWLKPWCICSISDWLNGIWRLLLNIRKTCSAYFLIDCWCAWCRCKHNVFLAWLFFLFIKNKISFILKLLSFDILLWIKLILIWLTPFIHYCIKFKWSCLRCILVFSITWFINIRYLFLNNWNRSRLIFIVRINQLSKYHPIRS